MYKKLKEYYLFPNKEIYYTIVEDKAILFDPLTNSFYNLNPVGTKIWELADGTYKFKEIIDIIIKEFEADKDNVCKDTIAFIKGLSKKRILLLSKQRRLI